jgi:ABC-type sugar transport system permease subunit
MEDFAAVVQQWNTFYFTIAAVTGTLLGLLFVAISLNIESLRQPYGIDQTIVPIFVLIIAATQTTWDFLTHR